MSEKNITDLSEIENFNISEEDLPDVISEQFEAIVDVDKRIVEAEKGCHKRNARRSSFSC